MLSSLSCFLLLSGLFVEFSVSAPAAAPAHNQLVKRLNPVLDSSFGPNDPETKQIKDAFFDALELSSYAIDDLDRDDVIFKKYFNIKDKPTVRKVFKAVMGNLDPSNPNSPDKEGNALLGKIKVTRSDPDGDCKADATLMAQLGSYDTDTPLLEVCPKAGFGHGGIGKDPHMVKCENLGDTVSWRMETLGSILLHEYT